MSEVVFMRPNIADETSEGICWLITGNEARCIGHHQLENELIDLAGHQDLLSALTSENNKSRVKIHDRNAYHLVKTKLEVGKYYPRIFRRILGKQTDTSVYEFLDLHEKELTVGSYIQAKILHSKLEEICKFIHPKIGNMEAYGSETRNLLILACTEVEAQFVGILKANHIKPERGRYTTRDYAKLLKAMKLNDYRVNIFTYPWLGSFSPFENWSEDSPTQSLDWYDAYNAVKHDRESEFHRATFRHAFNATVACNILIAAQFGQYNVASSDYRFEKLPLWHAEEIYIPPQNKDKWEIQQLSFTS